MAKFLFILLSFMGSSNTQLRSWQIGAKASEKLAGSSTVHKLHSNRVTGLATNIPGGGVPGQHYPILASVPQTGFSCQSQEFPGYFADTADEARCQVFHICQFDGRLDSFLCPNGTVFNQQYFVCDWWFNVDCAASIEPVAQKTEISVIKQSLKSLNSESEVFSSSYRVTPELSKDYSYSQVQERNSYQPSLSKYPFTSYPPHSTSPPIVTDSNHPATDTLLEHTFSKLNKVTESSILNRSSQYEILHSMPTSFPSTYLASSVSRSNDRLTQYLESLALELSSLDLKDNITNYDDMSKEIDISRGLDKPPSQQRAELGQDTPETDESKQLTNLYQISRNADQVYGLYQKTDLFDREVEPSQSPEYSTHGIEPFESPAYSDQGTEQIKKYNQSDRVKKHSQISGQFDKVTEQNQTPRHYARVTEFYKNSHFFDQVTEPYQKPNRFVRVTEPSQNPSHFVRVTEPYQNPNHFVRVTEPSQKPNRSEQANRLANVLQTFDQDSLVGKEPDVSGPHQDSSATVIVAHTYPSYVTSNSDIIRGYLSQQNSKTILVNSYYSPVSPSSKDRYNPPPAVMDTYAPSSVVISLAVKESYLRSSLTVTDYYPHSGLTPSAKDRYLPSLSDMGDFLSSHGTYSSNESFPFTVRNPSHSPHKSVFTIRNTISPSHKPLPFTIRNSFYSSHNPLPFTIRNPFYSPHKPVFTLRNTFSSPQKLLLFTTSSTFSSSHKSLPFTIRKTSLLRTLPFTMRNVYFTIQPTISTHTRHIATVSADLHVASLYHHI